MLDANQGCGFVRAGHSSMKKIFVACIVLLLLLIVAAAGFGLYYPDHVITRLLTTSRWEPVSDARHAEST